MRPLALGSKLLKTGLVSKPLVVLVTGDPVPEATRAHGTYFDMIRARVGDTWTAAWQAVDAREALELPAPQSVAGVIVTGSAAYVGDAEPWIARGLRYLQALVDAGTPTFGICFGHQMLGQALGGEVGRNPNGREIGSVDVEVLGASLLLPAGVPLRAQTTHLDSILRLPPGARVLARTKLEPHALVQFAPRVWGVQFHPEMDAAIVRHYIDARRDCLGGEGFSLEQLYAELDPGHAGASTLPLFVRHFVSG